MRQDRLLKALLVLGFAAAAASAQSDNSRVCAGCHRNIWESYRKTGMGRSFYRPLPENIVEDFQDKNTFYHQPSDSYFAMLAARRRILSAPISDRCCAANRST